MTTTMITKPNVAKKNQIFELKPLKFLLSIRFQLCSPAFYLQTIWKKVRVKQIERKKWKRKTLTRRHRIQCLTEM